MKYPKVLNLGSPYTENALIGEVLVQEKVDGSQFRWGWDEEGEFYMASKNRQLYEGGNDTGMFSLAMDYMNNIREGHPQKYRGKHFFGEYLAKPKHNTLEYVNVPKNNIVLFDAYADAENTEIPGWMNREMLTAWADNIFKIDLIPELYKGVVAGVDQLKELHSTESYLGGCKIEGVCIKNYEQLIEIGGQIRPLFTKYVSTEFREKHEGNPDHTSRRETIDEWIKGFATEARFQKAYQHLLEDGKITHELKDIGGLIKEVIRDLEEESTEYIKNFLYERYQRQVKGSATRGLPDWYKNKLLERLNATE